MNKKGLQCNVYVHSIVNKFLYCLVSFVGNIFLTRCLGTELNGEYTYIINTANIISIIAGLGIYQSIPFFNRKNKDLNITLHDYVNVFLVQSILYFFILACIWGVLPETEIKLILILALLDNLTQQLNMLILIKDVYKRNKIFLIGAMVSLLMYGCCYFINTQALVVILILTIIVKVYYVTAYLLAIGKPINIFHISLFRIKEYIAFGYLPMLTYLLITMNYKIDVIMLKWFPNVSNAQLSYYSLGVTISEIVWIISDVFKDVIFAKTAKENQYDEVSAAIRVSNCLLLLIVVGMVIFGNVFIQIFYGKEFSESFWITIVLLCGVPFMSWFKIINPLFNALGKRRFSFLTLLFVVGVNVLLNAVLIPRLGIYGAAVASFVSYFICGMAFLKGYAKESGGKVYQLIIPTKKDFYRIFVKV